MKSYKLMTLAGVALTLGLGDSAVAGVFAITGPPTVTIPFDLGVGNPIGTFGLTGNLDISLAQDLGTTAVFNVDAYALSLDVDGNGMFFDASDLIVETTPFTNILAVDPSPGVLSQLPGPITLTTDAASGTWNMTGRIAEYIPSIAGTGGSTDPTLSLASGTFSGSLLDPTELLMTLGYRSQPQLGPFDFIDPFPPITFTAVPEPTTLSLLIFGTGAAAFRHRRRSCRIELSLGA